MTKIIGGFDTTVYSRTSAGGYGSGIGLFQDKNILKNWNYIEFGTQLKLDGVHPVILPKNKMTNETKFRSEKSD